MVLWIVPCSPIIALQYQDVFCIDVIKIIIAVGDQPHPKNRLDVITTEGQGGWGRPKVYYVANSTLEWDSACPWQLEALLHSKILALPNHLKHNILYRDTIIAWLETLLVLGQTHLFTRHTPILGNPMFLQGSENAGYKQLENGALSRFLQLFHSKTYTPKTFDELKVEFNIPNSHVFYFLQTSQDWKSLHSNPTQAFKTTFIDSLIQTRSYLISTIYEKLRCTCQTKANTPPTPTGPRIFMYKI